MWLFALRNEPPVPPKECLDRPLNTVLLRTEAIPAPPTPPRTPIPATAPPPTTPPVVAKPDIMPEPERPATVPLRSDYCDCALPSALGQKGRRKSRNAVHLLGIMVSRNTPRDEVLAVVSPYRISILSNTRFGSLHSFVWGKATRLIRTDLNISTTGELIEGSTANTSLCRTVRGFRVVNHTTTSISKAVV